MRFDVFWCRNQQKVCFVGIYLTATLEVSQLPLPISSKKPNGREISGSSDRGELDFNSDVNQPDSGKLQKYTTVSSQCEQLY